MDISLLTETQVKKEDSLETEWDLQNQNTQRGSLSLPPSSCLFLSGPLLFSLPCICYLFFSSCRHCFTYSSVCTSSSAWPCKDGDLWPSDLPTFQVVPPNRQLFSLPIPDLNDQNSRETEKLNSNLVFPPDSTHHGQHRGAGSIYHKGLPHQRLQVGWVLKKVTGRREEMIGIFRIFTHPRDGLVFGKCNTWPLWTEPPFASVTTFSAPPFCDSQTFSVC